MQTPLSKTNRIRYRGRAGALSTLPSLITVRFMADRHTRSRIHEVDQVRRRPGFGLSTAVAPVRTEDGELGGRTQFRAFGAAMSAAPWRRRTDR